MAKANIKISKVDKIIIPQDKIGYILLNKVNELSDIEGVIEDKRSKAKSYLSIEAPNNDLNLFDVCIFLAAIAQQQAGNECTTAAILYRTLGGNPTNLSSKQREKILKSIEKLIFTKFKYGFIDDVLKSKSKWKIDKEFEENGYSYVGALLPAEIVAEKINSNLTRDAIRFLDESPIFKIAKMKNQLAKFDAELLDVPKLSCTETSTRLKIELLDTVSRLRRIDKRNKKSRKGNKSDKVKKYLQLSLKNLYENCGLSQEKNRQCEYRKMLEKILNHFKNCGFIKAWQFAKTGNNFTHINFL